MSAAACNLEANPAAMAPLRPSLWAPGEQATGEQAPGPVAGPAARSGNLGRFYRRAYTLRGQRDTCLLQRVSVHIRYRRGAHVVVDYRTTYFEFFQFEAEGATVLDVHDFDVVRDGWRQAAIDALLRRHLPTADRTTARGEPHLDVVKTFALGFGTVQGAKVQPVADGVKFGFVTFGATRAAQNAFQSGATLQLSPGENLPPIHVPGHSPCPPGSTISGTGVFTSRTGWRAIEHFRYRFACLAGSLRDRAGYRASTLPTNRLCST